MRRMIALATALALASAALPAFAAGAQHNKRYVPSLDDLVANYATQISNLTTAQLTVALSAIAAPSTTFNVTGAVTTIQAAAGTSAFIPTIITEVNAAIAAHQAAVGPGYVSMPQSFYTAAMAAKLSGTTP